MLKVRVCACAQLRTCECPVKVGGLFVCAFSCVRASVCGCEWERVCACMCVCGGGSEWKRWGIVCVSVCLRACVCLGECECVLVRVCEFTCVCVSVVKARFGAC